MILRRATLIDAEFILMVRNDPASRAASRTDVLKDGIWYRTRLDDPAHFCYVAEIDGVPVGYASLQRHTPIVAEVSIALAPAARGQGLSHGLIDAVVAEGRKMGIERFLATVRGENVSSLRAFLHEGFMPSKWVYLERTK